MHNIVKRGPKDYHCTVCQQSWTTESKGHCPGLPVYAFGRWGALLTKNQLSAKGYSVTPATLPPPVGCYRRPKDDYVFLYDPSQAQLKKRARSVRITYYLESLLWPYSQLGVLDEWREMEGRKYEPSERNALLRIIADMAVHLGAFAPHESAVLTDGALLTLTPAMTVHRQYTRGFWDEREKLVERIVRAYGRFLWTPRLMDDAVAEFRQRQRAAEDEAREHKRQALAAERRAKLFEMHDRGIDLDELLSAVQLPLFDLD